MTSEHGGNGTIFHSLWSDPVGDQTRNLPVSGGTLDPKGSTVTAGQKTALQNFAVAVPTSSFCMAAAQTGESSSTPTSSGTASRKADRHWRRKYLVTSSSFTTSGIFSQTSTCRECIFDCMITRLLKLNWHHLHKSMGILCGMSFLPLPARRQ